MTSPRDEPIATLQDEVRRAGRLSWRVRRGGGWLVVLFCLLLVAVPIAYGDRTAPFTSVWNWIGGLALATVIYFWLGRALGATLILPIVALHRLQQRQLRRRLLQLSSAERASVLLPLRNDPLPDTRGLVEPLLRELGLPSELTPAAAPEGRGDETSPADT
jgi:hypothetical protein